MIVLSSSAETSGVSAHVGFRVVWSSGVGLWKGTSVVGDIRPYLFMFLFFVFFCFLSFVFFSFSGGGRTSMNPLAWLSIVGRK